MYPSKISEDAKRAIRKMVEVAMEEMPQVTQPFSVWLFPIMLYREFHGSTPGETVADTFTKLLENPDYCNKAELFAVHQRMR